MIYFLDLNQQTDLHRSIFRNGVIDKACIKFAKEQTVMHPSWIILKKIIHNYASTIIKIKNIFRYFYYGIILDHLLWKNY